MAVVTAFPAKEAGPKSPKFSGSDDFILRLIAEWRVARYQQQIIWAQHEQKTVYGHVDGVEPVDTTNLDKMCECEWYLAGLRPTHALAAQQLLDVAVEMLAHQHIDTESTLASGPALEIIKNVKSSLEFIDGTKRLLPNNAKE